MHGIGTQTHLSLELKVFSARNERVKMLVCFVTFVMMRVYDLSYRQRPVPSCLDKGSLSVSVQRIPFTNACTLSC